MCISMTANVAHITSPTNANGFAAVLRRAFELRPAPAVGKDNRVLTTKTAGPDELSTIDAFIIYIATVLDAGKLMASPDGGKEACRLEHPQDAGGAWPDD
jgi:hypothetical protein